MEPAGSTLIDHPCAARDAFRRTDAPILGNQLPHAEVANLLLPMVRRFVRTERGPAALVSWLRRSGFAPADHHTEQAVAEVLARLLSQPAGSPADTLVEAR